MSEKAKDAVSQLMKGIEDYVDITLDKSQFDKTISGVITKINNDGTYNAKVRNKEYKNIKAIGSGVGVNEKVNILLPNGNYDQMLILCTNKSSKLTNTNTYQYIQLGDVKICWGRVLMETEPEKTSASNTNRGDFIKSTNGLLSLKAGYLAHKTITYPITYNYSPAVFTNINTSAPSIAFASGSANVTNTNFNLYIARCENSSSATTWVNATTVYWMAIGV